MEDNKIYAWTPMIRTSDMRYPVYLSDFRKEYPNVSMGDWVWEDSMADNFNYFVVRDSEVPVGDVVTEGQPAVGDDGRWYKTWTSRPFTPEEVAQNLAIAKEDHQGRGVQQYHLDLQTGVTVDGKKFTVDGQNTTNLIATRAYAQANPTETVILVLGTNFEVSEYPAADAIVKIDSIFAAAGEAEQRMLAYVKLVGEATLITDIPEVPATFLGE